MWHLPAEGCKSQDESTYTKAVDKDEAIDATDVTHAPMHLFIANGSLARKLRSLASLRTIGHA